MPKKVIGIDLGTTFSCVAHIDEHGKPETILNNDGIPITASAVLIENLDNIVVGQIARDSAVAMPENVIILVKRLMGTKTITQVCGQDFTPEEISAIILKKLKQDAEMRINETITEAVITVPAYFGAPERQATKTAGEMAGLNVHEILNEPVATALAYGFTHPEKEETLLVYDLGGGTFDITLFKVSPPDPGFNVPKIDMISTSGNHRLGGVDWDTRVVRYAAIAFLLNQVLKHIGSSLKKELTDVELEWEGADANMALIEKIITRIHEKNPTLEDVAVTPDTMVALLELVLKVLNEEYPATEKATSQIVQELIKAVADQAAWRELGLNNPLNDTAAHQDFIIKCEKAKCALSSVGSTRITCQFEGRTLAIPIDRVKLRDLTHDLLEMTATEIDLLIMDKGYTQDMIDQVLCAGSSTRLEMVRDMLNAKFPGKVNLNIDPDQCVAQGAAWYAHLLGTGQEPVVCAPHALGVAARDHTGQKKVYPLIVKDQKLPCTESDDSFSIGQDNLTTILVEIYELEASRKDETMAPEACNKLGEVLVEGLPPGRPAYQPVEITFSFDKSFLLSVVAKDLNSNTDASTHLNIGSRLDGPTKEKTRKMLEGMEIKS